MSPFDECSVLIPSSTLEDFPSDVSDSEARGLLAAWTVLWHPALLASTKQAPTWYRADSPPEPDGPRVVAIPAVSASQLPKNYRRKCEANHQCRLIDGPDRESLLGQLGLDTPADLIFEKRKIGVADFFAAGYAALQVQVMTRRLRYTSNLDELYLQNRVVEGASEFLAGNAAGAAEALHDVFDCLAEERDHYFSSDPHLIDLQLLTPDVLHQALDGDWTERISADLEASEEHGVLQLPSNVLIDHEVAESVSASEHPKIDEFRSLLTGKRVGWAGGSPHADVCFDAMSFSEAEETLISGKETATRAVGDSPAVYARFSGTTPDDLTGSLVRAGYVGLIPIDFAAGTGHGDESKVIQQSAGAEIESLTAKPIDAGSDVEFLSLGARLGECIDGGEIATALLAHWPNRICDSYADLRRAASWSVVLGKFWQLEDYFREGEKPYHHATSKSSPSDAAGWLGRLAKQDAWQGIANSAAEFRSNLRKQIAEQTDQIAVLASGITPSDRQNDSAEGSDDHVGDVDGAGERLAKALGGNKVDSKQTPCSVLAVNPHSVACRIQTQVRGGKPNKSKHIYAVSQSAGDTLDVTFDVTGYGFSQVIPGGGTAKRESWLKRVLVGGENKIADDLLLTNEFLAVSIDPETAGVASIYSGGERGNRFSLRLVYSDGNPAAESNSNMVCKSWEVTTNSPAEACIECNGVITDKSGTELATFQLQYRLQRGSRLLEIAGSIKPSARGNGDPWRQYFAARAAVANDSAIVRSLVRDKIHRLHSRRLVAPLGVLIDEAERQTLVASAGNAFHRRVGDRFVDSLICGVGEETSKSEIPFRFAYGFDTPDPVSTAKATIAPLCPITIETSDKIPEQGWLMHVSPTDSHVIGLNVQKRDDGKLAAIVRVVNTRPQPKKTTLRFCRPVDFARWIRADQADDPIHSPKPDEESRESLEIENDAVKFSASGHEVAELIVVFQSPS